MRTGLTLDEIERQAFVSGDTRTVALIHQGEEEFSLEITFEHQLMIDESNRMREALENIIAAHDAGDLTHLDEMLAAGEIAIAHVEPQCEVTLRELVDSQDRSLKDLRTTNDRLRTEIHQLRMIKSMCSHLLRDFIGKHHPAWAEALKRCIKENS